MKMTKMMIAGGLVLTLGAFSPVFAQSSKDSTPQKASYSDTSNASSSPSSSDSATDQSQDQNSTSAQPSDESASSQNAASDNQQDQKIKLQISRTKTIKPRVVKSTILPRTSKVKLQPALPT